MSNPLPAIEQLTRVRDDIDVVNEMEDSFLAYSLSVNTGRAIPDVRDGLKPVQRRILYAMLRGGLRPERGYGKSGRTVGDVLGSYHPHGDAAIYHALVRLAQSWAMRVPLVDGHGNLGSLDDGPAAMRYTEARLGDAAMLMLEGIDESTVDWVPTYDGEKQEPDVLPSALPNLLINGTSGIGVALATTIPPHNPTEVGNALIHLLDNPDTDVASFLEHLPGPDFPSGGTVMEAGKLADVYADGRGSVRLRAKAEFVDVSARRRGIVVTELPYMVGPEQVIKKVSALVKDGKLSGVADIKDLSDRHTGLRLLIECKSGIRPEALLETLYQKTPLEQVVSVNTVVLVDGEPQRLGFLEIARHYLAHRFEVLRRRTQHRLDKAREREHLLEGLVVALADIDDVVAIIRGSSDSDEAKAGLLDRFELTETQAEHILAMQLRRLTALEVDKIHAELAELREQIADYEDILGSDHRQTEEIRSQINAAVAGHGDERRTVLSGAAPSREPVELRVPDAPCAVAVTIDGKMLRAPLGDDGSVDTGRSGTVTREELITVDGATSTHSTVLVVTSDGKGHYLPVVELPDVRAGSQPAPVPEFLAEHDADADVVAIVDLGKNGDGKKGALAILTEEGTVKRLDLSDLTSRNPNDLIAFENGDRVVAAGRCDDGHIIAVTDAARLLRIDGATVRAQKRSGSGVAGVKLADGAKVIAGGVVPADAGEDAYPLVVTATDGGKVKFTGAGNYPVKGRGGQGVRCHNLLAKDSGLVDARIVERGRPVALTAKNRPKKIPDHRDGRDTSGRSLGAAPARITVSYR